MNFEGIANPNMMIKDGADNEAINAVKLNNWIAYQDYDPLTDIANNIKDSLENYDWSNFGGPVGASSGVGPVPSIPSGDPASNSILDDVGAGIPTNVPVLDGSGNTVDTMTTEFQDSLQGVPSISEYVREHPGASMEDVLKFMASQSDEWAEKYMDYILEKQSITEQNAYTASREDTAYQRLVQDLKKAGLNPAMMYGSSAGTYASGSSGIVRANEGANSRNISNYSKLKKILISYLFYQSSLALGLTNSVGNGLTSILGSLFG